MSSMIESLIVVCNPHGYVASLRFDNSRDDMEISGTSKWYIFKKIDQLLDDEGCLRVAESAHPFRQRGTNLRFQRRPRVNGQGHSPYN